jgi:hypothetical protein
MIPPILEQLWLALLELLPKVVGALIVLSVGWLTGRLLGTLVLRVFRRAKIENAFVKTAFGKALERSGLKPSLFFDMVVRWFVYLGSFLIAVDILGIEALKPFANTFVHYIPLAIGGAIILVLGLIAADFLADLALAASGGTRREYASIFIIGLRFFMYFVVAIVSLSIMKIDVSILYVFANALAWGIAGGIGVGLGVALGWGFKDTIAKNAEKWIGVARVSAEKVEETAEVLQLQERVKELEATLAEHRQRIESLTTIRIAKIEELMSPEADLHTRLRELIDAKGQISDVLGGYKILVSEPMTFPWREVLITLMGKGYDVWLSKEDEKFFIKSKEPSAS